MEILKMSWQFALIGFCTSFSFLLLWFTALSILGGISSYVADKKRK